MVNSSMQSILKRLRNSDKKAMDEIYCLYYKKLLNFCVSYLKDEDAALDVIQETFIKLWDKHKTLSGESSLDALLYTISKNTILSIFRKRLSEEKYQDFIMHAQANNSSSTENVLNYNLLNEKYKILVDQLPEKRKEIFLLSREKGKSTKEIAEQLNISEKTVKNQMTQALAFLKKNLDNIGGFGALFYWLFVS
jgi:RNA polymerase sigma-70 factor (ECF subfamily)